MPGGLTKVWRRFARMSTREVQGELGVGMWCWIRPMPSLFAEPSRPREMGILWVRADGCESGGVGFLIRILVRCGELDAEAIWYLILRRMV